MKTAKLLFFLAFPIVAAICLLRPSFFLAELIQSLALQIAFLFLVLGLALLAKNKIRSGLSASLSGGAMALSLLPWLLTESPSSLSPSPELRVAHFNVLYQNENHLPLIEQVLDTNADFISFQEVTHTWATQLEAHLSEEYPYSLVVPHHKGHGIAIFSRLPLEDLEVQWYSYVPSLAGSICLGGQPVKFTTAHTRTPTSPEPYRHRNHQLAQMAALHGATTGPSLLVGDLNSVPWSPELIHLLDQGHLTDSRQGWAATYPAWFTPGRIPIDYILHSGELQCLGFQTIQSIGSDHLGIVSDFALSDPAASLATL